MLSTSQVKSCVRILRGGKEKAEEKNVKNETVDVYFPLLDFEQYFDGIKSYEANRGDVCRNEKKSWD